MNSKTTTTREYDDSGRLVKEIITTEDVPSPAVTVAPSTWMWPHGAGCWCGWCKPAWMWPHGAGCWCGWCKPASITWTQTRPYVTYNSAASLGSGVSYT